MKICRFFLIALTIVMALALFHPAQADKTTGENIVKVISGKDAYKKVNDLLVKINQIAAEGKRLNANLKSVSNEERLVLKLRRQVEFVLSSTLTSVKSETENLDKRINIVREQLR